jgi:hypothetical protein
VSAALKRIRQRRFLSTVRFPAGTAVTTAEILSVPRPLAGTVTLIGTQKKVTKSSGIPCKFLEHISHGAVLHPSVRLGPRLLEKPGRKRCKQKDPKVCFFGKKVIRDLGGGLLPAISKKSRAMFDCLVCRNLFCNFTNETNLLSNETTLQKELFCNKISFIILFEKKHFRCKRATLLQRKAFPSSAGRRVSHPLCTLRHNFLHFLLHWRRRLSLSDHPLTFRLISPANLSFR